MAGTSAAAEVQTLLRFLSQDAKIPLADAMSKVGILRQHGLTSVDSIAKAESSTIRKVFVDEKTSKSVVSAAKRATNPRKRAAAPIASLPAKRHVKAHEAVDQDLELDLTLPTAETSVEELIEIEIETNRAPLFLAFTTIALKYTMPEQPLSSRLSLAQAAVSANSQSKAKSIGLTMGPTAEDDGWAMGQPKVRVLDREIAILRRHIPPAAHEADSQETVQEENAVTVEAIWALDLEALRKSNGPLVAGKSAGSHGPPVYRPEAARAYLLKSFSLVEKDMPDPPNLGPRKATAAEVSQKRQYAAALVLRAIDLLCASWASTLSKHDLDKRAWAWYVNVRPDVQQGQAGWGQRGRLKLSSILDLRRDL